MPIRQFATMVLLASVTALSGGCSFSLGNMFGGSDAKKPAPAEEATGSINPIVRVHDNTDLSESDLALARTAASDVLTRGASDTSQPWENPATGARGSVTPLASAYTGEDGRTCRDFLASYVRGASEGWLQGEACKAPHGAWEIRNLKPWKRS